MNKKILQIFKLVLMSYLFSTVGNPERGFAKTRCVIRAAARRAHEHGVLQRCQAVQLRCRWSYVFTTSEDISSRHRAIQVRRQRGGSRAVVVVGLFDGKTTKLALWFVFALLRLLRFVVFYFFHARTSYTSIAFAPYAFSVFSLLSALLVTSSVAYCVRLSI